MSILVFVMGILIMSMINKYILKEKNILFSIGIAIFLAMAYFRFGMSIEFFKVSSLALILAIIGWIDFKTQDVYTFHIIIGTLIGIIFLGIEFFSKNQVTKESILSFLILFISILVIGIMDFKFEDEKWIYAGMVSIYLLYFLTKSNPDLLNVFTACVIPSLVIGGLSLAGGMGWGDVEIIFMCGLFLNFKMSLVNLFLGILLGGMYSIYLITFKKREGKTAIAFGPYIALGTGITVLFGEQILNWYINFI